MSERRLGWRAFVGSLGSVAVALALTSVLGGARASAQQGSSDGDTDIGASPAAPQVREDRGVGGGLGPPPARPEAAEREMASMPSSDGAAAASSLDGVEAIQRALAAHPGYRATAIEVRRARDHYVAETWRWVPVVHLEGGFNVGNTPSLQANQSVAFPYNEQFQLVAEIQQPIDTGTMVALRATGSRRFQRSVFSFMAGMAPVTFNLGPGYGFDLTLTATQSFLRGFGSDVGRAEQRNAEAALAAAEATRDRRATELVRDTLQAYAELWYAEQSVVINASARDLAQRQVDEAQARLEVGVLSPADTLAFATRVASLEEVLALSEADRRSKATLLATLLGMPLGSEIHASSDPPALPFSVSDAEAVHLAVEGSPQLEELRAQVEITRRAARVAAEPLRPRLDAQAQVGLHGLGYDDAATPFAQVASFAAFTAMVSLVYETPVEDARLHAEEERARLAVDVAEERVAEAQATIEQQVMALLQQRGAARRRIELASATIDLAERSVEAERGRLEVGTRTPTALLAAEEELRNAALRLRRARVDLYATETALLAFVGHMLDGVDLPE
ncbi:MAG: TolC family protein [Sandaracinus sp.]